MPYKWTDTDTIQGYLSDAAAYEIGDDKDFSEGSAMRHENDSVSELTTLLSAAWEGIENLTTANAPAELKSMAAKLTAARLAKIRAGSTQGNIPAWIDSYKDDVFAQVRRMVINSDVLTIEGVTRRDVRLDQLLIKAKSREFIPAE